MNFSTTRILYVKWWYASSILKRIFFNPVYNYRNVGCYDIEDVASEQLFDFLQNSVSYFQKAY